MPTFFATFQSLAEGRETVDELLRDGVPPENISLVAARGEAGSAEGLSLENVELGDASFYVGRSDDPEPSQAASIRKVVAQAPRLESQAIGGPDTSTVDRDVDKIDESDNSQELAEETLYPFRQVSYGSREFEKDELELGHGFPTRPDAKDDVFDEETPLEDQNVNGLESISFGGRGTVVGSGALATVALDFLNPTSTNPSASIFSYLVDDGVPRPDAEAYRQALVNGQSLMAVEIMPGRTHEDRVEEIVIRHHGEQSSLFSGRRFHDRGGLG